MQAGFLKKDAVVAAIPAEALEAKFELCLTACAALRCKPADEEEPYVYRYEERDALQQLLKQTAANAAVEPEGAEAARARVVGGVLECWLGINFMDTEEPGSGQARLERAIEALDTSVAPAEAVRLLDALTLALTPTPTLTLTLTLTLTRCGCSTRSTTSASCGPTEARARSRLSGWRRQRRCTSHSAAAAGCATQGSNP